MGNVFNQRPADASWDTSDPDATVDPEDSIAGFHILDLIRFSRRQPYVNLFGSAWEPIYLPTITRVATMALPDYDAGLHFTVHTPSGSLQGVTVNPSATTMAGE